MNAINHFIILNDFPCKRFNLVINYSFYCHYHLDLWPPFLQTETQTGTHTKTHRHITFPLLSQRILTAISSVVTNLLELIQERANVLCKTCKHTSFAYLVHAISNWNEIVRDLTSFRVDNFHFFIVQLQCSSVRCWSNSLKKLCNYRTRWLLKMRERWNKKGRENVEDSVRMAYLNEMNSIVSASYMESVYFYYQCINQRK